MTDAQSFRWLVYAFTLGGLAMFAGLVAASKFYYALTEED